MSIYDTGSARVELEQAQERIAALEAALAERERSKAEIINAMAASMTATTTRQAALVAAATARAEKAEAERDEARQDRGRMARENNGLRAELTALRGEEV